MTSFIKALLASTLLSISPLAADLFSSPTGLYIGVAGGPHFMEPFKKRSLFFKESDARTHMETGYFLGGMVGYRFCLGMRLEAEVSYRHNAVKSNEDPLEGFQGNISSTNYLLNGYYDFFFVPYVTPYFGAGLGYAKCDYCKIGLSSSRRSCLAAQLIGGISMPIHSQVEIGLDYRYFTSSSLLSGLKLNGHTIALTLKGFLF